jgi:hypothetical protein
MNGNEPSFAQYAEPWIVSDLESSGWIERYSAQDASLAPAGEQLVQAQMPIGPGTKAPTTPACAWSGCWMRPSRTGAAA